MRMTNQLSLKRKPLFAIGALVVGCVIGLVVAEAMLRIFPFAVEKQINIEEDNQVARSDPVLGHVLTPNSKTYGHDERGFKNPEVLAEADIVALGDSHTNGLFEEGEYITWPHYLDQLLPGSRVYNMGVHGYGFAQYKMLVDDALELNPETVIIAPYLGNDLFDTYDMVYHYDAWSEYRSDDFEDTEKITADERDEIDRPLKSVRKFIRKYSALYAFLGNRTRLWRERIGLAAKKNVGVSDWSINDSKISLRFNHSQIPTMFWPGNRVRGVDMESKNIKEGLRLAKIFLNEIKKEAEDENIEVVMVMIPTKMRVYEKEVGERAEQNELYTRILASEKEIEGMLLSYCREIEMHCFSIHEYLQEQLADGRTLYPKNWNGHPVAEGYRAYAEAIAHGLSSEVSSKE